ncbi:hypothetical protein [Legionella saoudiensis]|uniref:hypothetical protein n=1 Tax=Legionella saoudiensis TaxID=1750561 RepID=UPI0007318411|nr:hypothetical protein [Legionella saoudiensis]
MIKKIFIAYMLVSSLSFISSAFADTEEVHWWHHPDQYHADFEEWYPTHKEVWHNYYSKHKDHYTTYCEQHRGWTFCE